MEQQVGEGVDNPVVLGLAAGRCRISEHAEHRTDGGADQRRLARQPVPLLAQILTAAPKPEYAGLYAVSGVSKMGGMAAGVFNMTFARNGAFIHLAAGNDDVWWPAQIADTIEPNRNGVSDTEWLRRTAQLYQDEFSVVAPRHLLKGQRLRLLPD